MSGRALGAASSAKGEGEGRETAFSHCIAGRIYRIVQTTGLDGKNLLKLLPFYKPARNLAPLAQSPVISDNAKGNSSISNHVSLKDMFTNTSTSSFVVTPEVKMATPGKLILPKPLGQVENVKVVSVVKEDRAMLTSSSIQSDYLSADRSSLQNDSASVSSDKSNSAYVLANTKNVPVTVKAPVLPSGHHLQIPAHAEVKSVPASYLPSSIQQKILAVAAASSASGTPEAAKSSPTVIYVSPVNTVKTTVSKPLQQLCSKPVTEISKSLALTAAQTAVSTSALGVIKSDSQQMQGAPMKWIVQENPQSSASCLVPVKSSNNVASKILKTLVDMKSVKNSPANILPACSSSLSGSQAKITSIKDNALVMYNGKIYLLTKKESSVTSARDDQQVSSSAEMHFRNNTSQLISSAADSTITNQVVNLVLSKNKGNALNTNDSKSCESVKPHLQSVLTNGIKSTSALLMFPHGNLQISSTSQHETVSTSEPIPVETNVAQNPITKKCTNDNVTEKILSPKASVAVLQAPTMHSTSEEEQKMEKMNSSKMIKHRKDQQRQPYLELRNKFGLFKEERVFLRRIPVAVSLITSEQTVCSSSVQMNDTCKLLPAAAIKPDPEEKEERMTGEYEEELNRKRKAKMSPMLRNTKRKKKGVKSVPDSNVDCSDCHLMENPSSPCREVVSQQENPTSPLQVSLRGDSDRNPDEENPISHCCENETSLSEGSFKDDIFSLHPPDLEHIIGDEKITRLKLLLSEQNALVEKFRKKMPPT